MTTEHDTISITDMSPEEESILMGLREMAAQEESKTAGDDKKTGNPAEKEFDERELLAIFDHMITQGAYIETASVGPRIRVAWKSRTVGEANAITRMIDTAGFNTVMAVQNHTNVLNMAYSLVGFNGKDFSAAKLSEKKAFLENMPEAVIVQLSRSLSKFDYKVSKATEVGQENF